MDFEFWAPFAVNFIILIFTILMWWSARQQTAKEKTKQSPKAAVAAEKRLTRNVIRYAMVSVVLILISWLPYIAGARQSPTTPKNVDERVDQWAKDFGLGSITVPSPAADAYYSRQFTLKDGVRVHVRRYKNRPNYLEYSGAVTVSDQDQAALSSLDPNQRQVVLDELLMEFGKLNFGVVLPAGEWPPKAVELVKSVPITGDYNDSAFGADVDRFDGAVIVTVSAFRLAIDRRKAAEDVKPK